MPNKPQHDAALLVLIKRSECGRTQLDLDQMRGILRKVRVQELFEQDEEINVEPIEIAEGFAGCPSAETEALPQLCLADNAVEGLTSAVRIDYCVLLWTYAPVHRGDRQNRRKFTLPLILPSSLPPHPLTRSISREPSTNRIRGGRPDQPRPADTNTPPLSPPSSPLPLLSVAMFIHVCSGPVC